MTLMRDDVKDHVLMRINVMQSEIIDLQKDVIDELFGLLYQYLTAEEVDSLPCVEKINEVARIKATMDGGMA